jgi:hypothetical protein
MQEVSSIHARKLAWIRNDRNTVLRDAMDLPETCPQKRRKRAREHPAKASTHRIEPGMTHAAPAWETPTLALKYNDRPKTSEIDHAQYRRTSESRNHPS